MSWLSRLRNLGRPDAVSDDIDREMRFHLAERIEELEATGLTPDEARREANRRFGNYTLEKERTRDRDLLVWVESLSTDLRCAVRALRGSPGLAVVAIVSLALGIGANTAIFTLINVAMLKPLPVSRPDELVALTPNTGQPSGTKAGAINRALFERIRDRRDLFAGALVYGSSSADLSRGGEARRVNVGLVTGDFFAVLGVRPVTGRLFVAGDDAPGCPAVAVITHAFWRREFGGAPDAIGRSVPLNGQPYPIVGVTDPDFFGVEYGWEVPVWIPQCAERLMASGSRAGGGLVLARLTPGVTPEQGETQLAAALPAMLQATVPPNAPPDAAARYRSMTIGVEPFANGGRFLRDRYGEALATLMVITGVVLLVACANIANLLLARATARRHEIAVRLALGASRLRLVRQWVTESVLLAMAGAAAGIVLAFWGSRGLVGLLSNVISIDLTPDATVLLFTAGAAVLTGVLFGLAPAIVFLAPTRGRRAGLLTRIWFGRTASPGSDRSTVMGGGRGTTESHARLRASRALVAAQIALSLVMLTAAALLLGSWGRLVRIDPGFRSDGVLLLGINTSPARLAPEQRLDTYLRLVDRLRAIPGVAAASAAWITPFGQNSRVAISADDTAGVPGRTVEARLNQVTESYFKTITTPLLAGRDFGPQDAPASPWVAIVNEQLARQVYGRVAVVGQRFRVQENAGLSDPFEIVGVVADTKWGGLREDNQPIVYYPLRQMTSPGPGMNFAIRADDGAGAIGPAVKNVVADIDPRFSLTLVALSQRVGDSIRLPRTLAVLGGFFGGLALLLAIVGLYGLMSYTVGRRRNEIAVRLALGAARPRLVAMVLGETGKVVAAGILIGLVLSFATTRFVATFLYGITSTDPLTFAVSAGILTVVALAAAAVPALRAARQNPVAALRTE